MQIPMAEMAGRVGVCGSAVVKATRKMESQIRFIDFINPTFLLKMPINPLKRVFCYAELPKIPLPKPLADNKIMWGKT